MAPHSMETILRPPQWPRALSDFVTWCLMWDPRNRPTSLEAMRHEYFADAIDPLRPRSSTSRILGKKQPGVDGKPPKDSADCAIPPTKPSWFRKSLVRDHTPVVSTPPAEQPAPPATQQQSISARPPPGLVRNVTTDATPEPALHSSRFRPFANKRATWTNGTTPSNAAPMPILPSIRPISPFSAHVNAQAQNNAATQASLERAQPVADAKPGKKIGRQLSVQSSSNHYADIHRQEAERALNGQRSPQSPSSEHKESFFSHLRKRARRFSGKPLVASTSPAPEDADADAGCTPWQSNRNSIVVDASMDTVLKKSMGDGDKTLQPATYGAQPLSPAPEEPLYQPTPSASTGDLTPQRQPVLSKSASTSALDSSSVAIGAGGPISSRTRRALHRSTHPGHMYDTPDEEEELLQEALNSASTAKKTMDRRRPAEKDLYRKSPAQLDQTPPLAKPSTTDLASLNPYPTPSPSAKRNGILFDHSIMAEPVTALGVKTRPDEGLHHRWPTPPYEENEWAASAAASIFAAGSMYR
ncbi:MAG: hypothetical protein Q9163_001555 [Psora crenata]